MPKRDYTKRSQGQAMLLVTIALIPMLGLVGLVTDIGYMQYVQRSAQTAADAAARSAAFRFHKTIAGSTLTCADLAYSSWICHPDPGVPCPTGLTSATNPVETASRSRKLRPS